VLTLPDDFLAAEIICKPKTLKTGSLSEQTSKPKNFSTVGQLWKA
jgi:hypothetical protein